MKKLKRCVFVLILGGGFLLSACSRIPGDSAPAGLTTPEANLPTAETRFPVFTQNVELQATLSIFHSWAEENRPALNAILREFSKRYPDIYFDVTYIPADELRDLYSDEAAQGRGPAILLGPVEWGPDFMEAGLIRELGELIDPEIIENLNPAAVESSHYAGSLVSLPYAIHGVVLYRNEDIMTIGADNFEELVMLAQAASQGEIAGAFLERSSYFSAGHLYGLGGSLMDENGYPAFATPEGEAWLRLLRAFEFAGKTAFLSDQDLEEFKAGRAGWIIEGSWKMEELAQAIGADRLTVDPWPEVENGRMSGFVHSDNLYLNSNVDQDTQDAAEAFMEFFLSQTAQSHLVEVTLIPALLYLDMPPTEMSPIIAQSMTALADGTAYPVLPVMDSYLQHLDLAIKSYLENGLSASDALNQASAAILEDLTPADVTPTP